jgi:hypothetical protein
LTFSAKSRDDGSLLQMEEEEDQEEESIGLMIYGV